MAIVNLENQSGIAGFYRQEVLPALYERLDRAFPEFHWQWQGRQWEGRAPVHLVGLAETRVVCRAPHGFTCADGRTFTWLEYLNDGVEPDGATLDQIVGDLARRSSVTPDPPTTDRTALPRPRAMLHHDLPRSTQLLEAFLDIVKGHLHSASGETCRRYLKDVWGFSEHQIDVSPLGLYSTSQEIRQRLLERGFTAEEIAASYLSVDSRCDGRIIIPARDPDGRLLTIFARLQRDVFDDILPGDNAGRLAVNEPVHLHLKGGTLPVALGLDLALTDRAGGKDNLILVKDRLEAVAFHARGILNVAAIGNAGEGVTSQRWERLRDYGVRQVTLALDYEDEQQGYLWATVREALEADRCPQIWILPPEVSGRPGVRWSSDTLEFKPLLQQRVHAFAYKAKRIVLKYGGRTNESLAVQKERILSRAHSFAEPLKARHAADLRMYFWPVINKAIGKQEPAKIPSPPVRTRRIEPAPPVESPQPKLQTVADQLGEHHKRLNTLHQRGCPGLVQATLPTLDAQTLGLRGLMLLAGTTNVGKTSLSLQIAADVIAQQEDCCVLFVSRQMSSWNLIHRIQSRLANVDWRRLVSPASHSGDHAVTEAEQQRIAHASEDMARWSHRLCVVDRSSTMELDVERVHQLVERLKSKTTCSRALVVVDELNDWPLPVRDRLSTAHADVVRNWQANEMQRLANDDLNLAILVTQSTSSIDARTREQVGSDELTTPMMSAADLVMLMQPLTDEVLTERFQRVPFPSVPLNRWRADLEESGINPLELEVAKARDGMTQGKFDLSFHFLRSRFEEGVPALKSYTEPFQPDGGWDTTVG